MELSDTAESVTGIEAFSNQDSRATENARNEVVLEPGQLSRGQKETRLIDPNESLRIVTDYELLLTHLDQRHKRVMHGMGASSDKLFPLSPSIIVGPENDPSEWIRVEPTSPDIEQGELRYLKNKTQNPDLDKLRRLPKGVARRLATGPEDTQSISVDEIEDSGIKIWLVEK